MNIRSISEFKLNYTYIYVLYFTIHVYTITASKYIYWFEENEDSEIILYSEIHENKVFGSDQEEKYYLKIIDDINSTVMNRLNYSFTYDDENFVNFAVFNDFSKENKFKTRKAMIECNFELLYVLKITKNIFELPDTISFSQFKCLLFILKHLKAYENKNLFKLLQGIFSIIYCNKNDKKLINKESYFKEIFRFMFSSESTPNIKKSIIQALLNILMIEHIFYENNLILTTKNENIFKTNLINENIPYKNLVIHDFKAFCILENFFRNRDISNTFQILLNEINIKSLIINNYQGTEFIDVDFIFLKPLAHILRSIIISNIFGSSENILNELYNAPNLKLEYFSLINLIVNCNCLTKFLSKHRLKGLVLNNVTMYNDINNFNSYMNSNKSLEYIEFKNIITNFSWLNCFTKTSNIKKIVLVFESDVIEKDFIKECDLLIHSINILYLEIWFDRYIISKEIFNFLKCLKSLKTLKLYNYKPSSNIDCNICEVFEKMKALENLVFKNTYLSDKFYNLLFQKKELKFLDLISSLNPKRLLNLEPFNNYCSITHLILRSMKINRHGLLEISKLVNLKELSLKFCDVESVENTPPINFISRSINKLCLKSSNLYNSEFVGILSNLDELENLNLADFLLHSCCLSRLNIGCNTRLKALSYQRGSLCINDLNRLKKLKVLEKLKLYKCKFIYSSFSSLGEDCEFFNSLRHLSLWDIENNLITIQYLLNFKNLQDLELPFIPFNYSQLQISRVCLPKGLFLTEELYKIIKSKNFYNEIYSDNISKYFKEIGIEAVLKCLI
ncbi:hypothetical protein CWI38_0155p0010 [Hamiltosporidium tvaerminnensis]|uniref:Uncharacterized protein n=1 Tax=Hamiltosporidium tvaerminnensis TaxID=1176355 RepID=A0A4Q9M2U1_9MICR|nr:hypothetical protein CWI38_0155p0010 [Hamiltosporidium tvaerminnensis]